MNTCATCRHFEAGEWSDRERKITTDAKQWIAAAEASEWVEAIWDGFCELAQRTNVYELWVQGADLPVIGIVEGAPMRTSSDGCCSSLHVLSTFGCNAWEGRE